MIGGIIRSEATITERITEVNSPYYENLLVGDIAMVLQKNTGSVLINLDCYFS